MEKLDRIKELVALLNKAGKAIIQRTGNNV